MTVKDKYFPLQGGLDLVTNPIDIPPGRLIAAKNYEIDPNQKGYTRIRGYERDDGRGLPSEASYWILSFTTGGTGELEVGAVINCPTSGMTGVVVEVVLESGSWAGGDAAGYAVLYDVTGSCSAAETVAFIGADDEFSSEFSSEFG